MARVTTPESKPASTRHAEPAEPVDPLLTRRRIDPVLELSLPATRDQLTVVRSAAETFLAAEFARRDCGELLADVLIALQEAASNVVRHAYVGRAEPGRMLVRAEVTPHLLRVSVSDEGRGYDPAQVPVPDFARPRDGGFGLHLMRETMSKVTWSRRGVRNTLAMEKSLEFAPRERAA